MDERPFLRPFFALLAFGLCGTAALSITLLPIIELIPPHLRGGVPVEVLTALSLVQPAVLLTIAVAVGVRLAERVGLRSRVAEWAAGRHSSWSGVRADLVAGLIGGALAVALLVPIEGMLTGEILGRQSFIQSRTPPMVISAVLYGGITEELMMRFGGMTLVAWALWRLRGDRSLPPGSVTYWTAIVVMALLFGAAHLGAASLSGPLTESTILRVVLLNAVAGVIFGWLYWRHSLESAMVAHGSFHLYFAAVAELAAALSPP